MKVKLLNKRDAYFVFVIFVSIYIEFGYRMVCSDNLRGWIRMLVLLLSVFPLLLSYISKPQKKSPALLFIYMLILLVLNAVRGGDDVIKNAILLVIPVSVGFLISSFLDFYRSIILFEKVVFFLAVYSIVTFLISFAFPFLAVKFPLIGYVYNSNTATIHDCLFSVVICNAQTTRNYGIAWEPGAFSILLSVALFISLFLSKEIKIKKIIIYVIAIITTLSTLGYFMMFGLFILKLQQKDNKSLYLKITIAILFSVFIIVLLFLPFSEKVFGKLSGFLTFDESNITYTTLARINAIRYPFEAFLSKPIFGIGYSEFYILNAEKCDGVATNTVMNWFACSGIMLGAPCLFFYLKTIISLGKNIGLNALGKILFVILSILLISTESLFRISLVYVIIFYGFYLGKKEKIL